MTAGRDAATAGPTERGLGDERLAALAAAVGRELPREYAAFLRARDGLRIDEPRSCELEVAGLPLQTVSVAELYGADEVERATAEFAGEVDVLDELFVIGEDGTGNLFVFDDPDVFYWDRARLHAFDDDRVPTVETAGGELYTMGGFESFVFRVIGAIRS